ncbi:lysine 2,3-aminomutase [Sinorhizobium numidicum]|uniref:Lysine 2,3-aminomutase n=1 Tax=Sinorhizobium numidicum TaxID=680248 RepID=A0ABY8CQ37_9HYPH|nr:4Fe-4S cluster-binding domain-containing protein [Sinorhizobium numidicum]WEX74773.1 lysine 2,3-aminomutase [Sinorhizobium numidicum]WEX80766.1 lysine 2,3-aminomutase [Sinorhizobium numidicum]
MNESFRSPTKFRAYTAAQFQASEHWKNLNESLRGTFLATTKVLPFRVNDYVLQNLIDWDSVPNDPMFQLLFPQPGMLSERDLWIVGRAMDGGSLEELNAAVGEIRRGLNPHPAGQMTHNVPTMGDEAVDGIQHKYRETVLFFPSAGQTCHSYCTFCFRWPQFVGDVSLRFQAKQSDELVQYLKTHPEVTDVLITGGDPMVMSSRSLERFITPILKETSVSTIRIGSKALTYWPFRFISDDDTKDLLSLFRQVVDSGRHLAFMAHFNHPREMKPSPVGEAIEAIRSTGAVIRTQAPILRHINDSPDAWAELWNESVRSGCVPYYMFVERDTGPSEYFKIPLVEVLQIFQQAYRRVSGLARTVRGPIMSATPGKVQIDGILEFAGRRMLQLQFLQARDPAAARQPLLAEYDETACWFDELKLLALAERQPELRSRMPEVAQ